MDESKVLELALQKCHTLERSLYDSIRMVRRLNIRYNTDWLLKNYKNYMSSIWNSADMEPHVSVPKKQPKFKKSQYHHPLGARSSHELCGSNRKINYKFIKIKRSMEAIILAIQRTIEIANRQKNYIHVNVLGRDSRTRICCH